MAPTSRASAGCRASGVAGRWRGEAPMPQRAMQSTGRGRYVTLSTDAHATPRLRRRHLCPMKRAAIT